MGKKVISSKTTYFGRQDIVGTEADWEAYKAANLQKEYTGEICWGLHDSMILRGKPASDSAITKVLLKEVGIEYDKKSPTLKITSDLTGKDILVTDIEDDELLEQLEAAGARVLYITSNPNYGFIVPNMYYDMYPENYNADDYPAIDKRNLFKGKNIIVKYINFFDYKAKGLYAIRLADILKENNMIINKALMNPPYDGSLHLDITATTIKEVRKTNPNAEIVSIQPARWLEDPLAEYKQGSDYKKYNDSIVNKISKLQLIGTDIASTLFKITTSQDLAVYSFYPNKSIKLNLFTSIAQQCLNKILPMLPSTIKDKVEQKVHNGWRCEIKEMLPVSVGSHGSDGEWSKTNNVCIVKAQGPVVFCDGYDENNTIWYKTRQANGHEDIDFLYSISFETKSIAENFANSCRATFYKNLVYLLKFDQHAPLRFLPYMEDYSHVWNDQDYCNFFGLDKEESEFMCRKVDDYRVKDFINYVDLKDED